MRKLLLFTVMLTVVLVGGNAWALLLNFDDPGQTLADNTLVGTQYEQSYGVTFLSGTVSSWGYQNVTSTLSHVNLPTPSRGGVSFLQGATYFASNNSFGTGDGFAPSTNFLGFQKSPSSIGDYTGTAIKFDTLYSSISFQLAKPGSNNTQSAVYVYLFNTNTGEVYDNLSSPASAPSTNWNTFQSTPGSEFNMAVLFSWNASPSPGDSTKFMLDNLSVPEPGMAWLLGSGLLGVLGLKRKYHC